jgi:hypothetical protein
MTIFTNDCRANRNGAWPCKAGEFGAQSDLLQWQKPTMGY